MDTVSSHDDLLLKAGTNQIELLEFHLDKVKPDGTVYQGIFGINVSKVLEVIRMTELTEVPHMPFFVIGMIHLRDSNIPIVSLAKWLDIQEPPRDGANEKVIITELNNNTIGFVVHQTTRIRRIPWEAIKAPPNLMNEKYGGSITGTTMVEEDRILLILDLEKIVADLSPDQEADLQPADTRSAEGNVPKRILVVDDSSVARKQIQSILSRGHYEVETAVNGKEAWQRMQEHYEQSRIEGVSIRSLVYLILTDVEMPEMDGYTLTRKLKEDQRFSNIPVVMHSSLSGEANLEKGEHVQCNEYLVKYDPERLIETVSQY